MALPLMALGQAPDQQQRAAQGQTNENKEKAPAKKKKARAVQEPGKPEARPDTGANMHGGMKAEGRAKSATKAEARARSSKTQTKVNVQEFKSRHREVFTLG